VTQGACPRAGHASRWEKQSINPWEIFNYEKVEDAIYVTHLDFYVCVPF